MVDLLSADSCPVARRSYVSRTVAGLILLVELVAAWVAAEDLPAAEPQLGGAPSTTPYINRDPREFCETEKFTPRCTGSDELIEITEAWYGRMQLSYCVRMNYGEVGCGADVRAYMASRCSGRPTCTVTVPEAGLEAFNKCPREFKNYLNVSYTCAKVETRSCKSCASSALSHIHITQPGYLASHTTHSSRVRGDPRPCGSASCPWRLEVASGQTINITLLEYPTPAASGGTSGIDSSGTCLRLAVIKETLTQRDSLICGGSGLGLEAGSRSVNQATYSSVGNVIDVQVIDGRRGLFVGGVDNDREEFLLYYEAVGCADMDEPANGWVRRKGDRLTMGCKEGGNSWDLVCVSNQWQGDAGNCAASSVSAVLIAIVLGIALVIGVLIVTVGVVCLRRQRLHAQLRPQTSLYMLGGVDPQCYELQDGQIQGVPKYNTPLRSSLKGRGLGPGGGANPQYLQGVGGRENQYAHGRNLQARPLPSIPSSTEVEMLRGPVEPIPTEPASPGGPRPSYHMQVSLGKPSKHSGGAGVPPKPPRAGSVLSSVLSGGPGPSSSIPNTPVYPSNPHGLQYYTILDPGDNPSRPPEAPPSPPLPPWPEAGTVLHPSRVPVLGGEMSPTGGAAEIALRPSRDMSTQQQLSDSSAGSGNSSWP